jgi:hypothetical protein
LIAAFLIGSGCSQLPGGAAKASPSVSASPTGTPLAKASGKLDAEAPMPPGFPTDAPIYPGSRLTAGASFTSTGQVAWGMEWETLDSVDKVQAFYTTKFGQGDWTIKAGTGSSGSFVATISRKSNPHAEGNLAVASDNGVTKVLLSLVSPSG